MRMDTVISYNRSPTVDSNMLLAEVEDDAIPPIHLPDLGHTKPVIALASSSSKAGPSSAGLDYTKSTYTNGNGIAHHPVNGLSPSSSTNAGKHRAHKFTVEQVDLPGTSLYPDDSGVDRQQFVRLVLQTLRDVGYSQSADALEAESGYSMEIPQIATFKKHILSADWDNAEKTLERLGLDATSGILDARILIAEQKYLEHLEAGRTKDALRVLRQEIDSLGVDPRYIQFLSSLMMCNNAEDLRKRATWDGASGYSRQNVLAKLQRFIPPSVMLPQRRLPKLLRQAHLFQQRACLYANTTSSTSAHHFSLYSDHHCQKTAFPRVTTSVLELHTDEVWNIEFSHDGRHLASASRDKTVIIWRIGSSGDRYPRPPERVHTLDEHKYPVGCLAWSRDDSILLTSAEQEIKMWDMRTGRCSRTLKESDDQVVALVWLPNGTGFLSASIDRKIFRWTVTGERIDSWDSLQLRVTSLAITPDSKRVVMLGMKNTELNKDAAQPIDELAEPPLSETRHDHYQDVPNSPHMMIICDFATKEVEMSLSASAQLTNIRISSDSKFALINQASDQFFLWDLKNSRLARKYFGQVHRHHVIRGCIGGAGENFVSSGTSGEEDGVVNIWHRDTGVLLERLTGHGPGSVNVVTWNPANPRMLASCSDDHTVRIWETDPRLTELSERVDCDVCSR